MKNKLQTLTAWQPSLFFDSYLGCQQESMFPCLVTIDCAWRADGNLDARAQSRDVRFPNSRIRSNAADHHNGQCRCHISVIRGREAAPPMPQQRRQLRIVIDQLSTRLDRWLAEPIRALDRMMGSLPPEKGECRQIVRTGRGKCELLHSSRISDWIPANAPRSTDDSKQPS
jgi:hypothetical protein